MFFFFLFCYKQRYIPNTNKITLIIQHSLVFCLFYFRSASKYSDWNATIICMRLKYSLAGVFYFSRRMELFHFAHTRSTSSAPQSRIRSRRFCFAFRLVPYFIPKLHAIRCFYTVSPSYFEFFRLLLLFCLFCFAVIIILSWLPIAYYDM